MILLHRLTAKNFKQLRNVALTFPQKGSILIEGHNEAGKSSLFEAVYFALFGSSLTGVLLGDLKTYHAESMSVELEFSVSDRIFRVTRTVRGQQSAELVFPGENGATTKLTGSKTVNAQIKKELELSADALLNTCFVEQKKLEALEDLNPTKRQEAVNELLNIEILNEMREQFRKRTGDNEDVLRAEKRVQIAAIDAEIPRIQQEESKANHCLIYREVQEKQGEIATKQTQIRAAEIEKASAQAQLTTHEKKLAEGGRLGAQLESLKGLIPSLYIAWHKAEQERHSAQAHFADLSELAKQLPQRRSKWDEQKISADQLGTLERLEAEARELNSRREAATIALTQHDGTLSRWESNTDEKHRLQNLYENEQADHDRAKSVLETRRSAIHRAGRLTLMLQILSTRDSIQNDADTLLGELEEAKEAFATLPGLQARYDDLRMVQAIQQEREKTRLDFDTTQENLTAHQRRLEDLESEHRTLATNEEREAELRSQVENLHAKEASAANSKREAELRTALQQWAEATERDAEADPEAGNAAEVEKRLALAEEKLETAKHDPALTGKRTLPAFGVLGGGGVLAIAAIATPFMIPLLVLALAVFATGVMLTVGAYRAKANALAEVQTVRGEFDRLQGEQKAVANQVNASLAQRESRAREKTAKQEELDRLGAEIPTSPESARTKAATLPELSVSEATRQHDAAKQALGDAQSQFAGLLLSLENERKRLSEQNSATLEKDVEALRAKSEKIAVTLQSLEADFREKLSALGVLETALDDAMQNAQRALIGCENKEAQIAELGFRLSNKQQQASAKLTEAQTIAQEISLEGENEPENWREIARAEQMTLEEAQQRFPEEALRREWDVATKTLAATSQKIAVLTKALDDDRQWLDEHPRAPLEISEQEIEQEIAWSQQRCADLGHIRPLLVEAGLPNETAPLQTRLALMKNELDRDTTAVEQLPVAQHRLEECQMNLAKQSEVFFRAWINHFPDFPSPETLAQVETAIEQTSLDITARRDALNLPQIETAKGNCLTTIKRLEDEIAGLLSLCDSREQEVNQWLDLLGGVTLSEVERQRRLPELVRAFQFTVETWREKQQELRDKLTTRRAERAHIAQEQGVSDEPLQLETEQALYREETEKLATKRRAFQMVEATRDAIVERVMPRTSEVASDLLQSLTAGRYKEMKWDQRENTLSIFDERARGYQQKRVFSGGARDQISLSLRLGFALATLPTGNNVRPRWLFLDEPLSSFDKERTQALVEMLTKGRVSQRFEQIFLVSHSESFDPALFDYRILMEGGAVKSSNLPSLSRQPELEI